MFAMGNRTFIDWLQEQLKTRAWSQSELARRSGISVTAINKVMNEERSPGADMCRGIAAALGMRDTEVFRIAGLISDAVSDEVIRLSEEDTTIGEAYKIMKSMNRVERYQALQYLRFLREQSASYDADVSADRGAAPKSSGQTSTGKAKPATS